MSYNAALYDLLTSEFTSDVDWYSRLAEESGGPVLELAAGTGRVVIPMASRGFEVDGLELHPGMLERFRLRLEAEPDATRRRVRVIEGDMRRFDLGRSYGLVQIPFRGFQHNLTREDQVACLLCCFQHLAPGGSLAFSVFHPSVAIMNRKTGPFDGVWRWGSEHAHPDGGTLLRSAAHHYDPPRQRVSTRHRYEHFDESGQLISVWLHRLELSYFYPGDLRELLTTAGFSEISISGDFEGAAVKRGDEELAVVARRP